MKGASSITKKFHSLKNLVHALEDCGSKIDEFELVMTNTKPFPSFLEVKNMLLIHELHDEITEASSDTVITSTVALYTSSSQIKSKGNFNIMQGALKWGVILMFFSKGNFNVSTFSNHYDFL